MTISIIGDRSIVRLVLYTIFNVLWCLVSGIFCVLLFIWTCMEACAQKNMPIRERRIYPIRAVVQMMWRLEIQVNAIYDTKADLRLAILEDILLSHAGWTAVYFIFWRSLQTAYYECIWTNMKNLYTSLSANDDTNVAERWLTDAPFTMTPESTTTISMVSFAFACIFIWFLNWLAVTIFVWMAKQFYYWVFGQLVVARVDIAYNPLLPTTAPASQERQVYSTIPSPPAPRPQFSNNDPPAYMQPFIPPPTLTITRNPEVLGQVPSYAPSLNSRSSSSSSQASEHSSNQSLAPPFQFTLVERRGVLGFPVAAPPFSTSSPPTQTFWSKVFSSKSNQATAKNLDPTTTPSLPPLIERSEVHECISEDETTTPLIQSRQASTIVTQVQGEQSPLTPPQNEQLSVHENERKSTRGCVVRSEVIAPGQNHVTIQVDNQTDCSPGKILVLGLPMPGGEVLCTYVISGVHGLTITILVTDESSPSLWLCGARSGAPVSVYGVSQNHLATEPSIHPAPTPDANIRDEVDSEDEVDLTDSIKESTKVPQVKAGWTSPKDYDIMSPLASPQVPFTPKEYEVPATYDILSPTSTNFQLPLPTRAFGSSKAFENPQEMDMLHFTAYAPPVVVIRSTFKFSIWAFLVHQRDEMHEDATADDVSTQLAREIVIQVRRGALVHITLEAPDGFNILDEPIKALTWRGSVDHVDFDIECLDSVVVGNNVFAATIVVGARIMKVRSYLFASMTRQVEDDIVQETHCEFEILPATYTEIDYDELIMKNLVGRGNFGDAFKATYRGQDVVVKTIRPSEFGDDNDQVVKEFQHEAAMLSLFGYHPNIVPFVGACTDTSKTLSLITKYLPHGSLEDQVSQHKLSSSQKSKILKDAAAGFLNIHEGGFIHRDIAARNCLLDDNLRGRICDFGLCRRVESFGGSHFPEGSVPLRYLAPESLTQPYSFSYQSDAYSFGVLMWETFTESKPYANIPSHIAAARIIQGSQLELSQAIPEIHKKIMEACFNCNPAKRPTMAQIYRHFDKSTH
ncbi:kinase [Thraustotheca clavata]|uniref:Kinase n=1 Tax=Thraustotheca clavata TaxID=74557 RepID=A0A1W0A1H7_9STRA|nr:kinase [Thraustotheca clavata]